MNCRNHRLFVLRTVQGAVLALAVWQFHALASSPKQILQPSTDDVVLEVLPTIKRTCPVRSKPAASMSVASASALKPADVNAATLQARQNIAVARRTGDSRYWGRAQTTLQPWQDRADAPMDIAVLQATVQQGRREFAASRKILTATLASEPKHAQGRLNLAALERPSARYT